MCENDQMVVIKHSAFEIDILRMILRFNFEDQYFIVNELTAIILFNPNRPGLQNQHILKHNLNVILMKNAKLLSKLELNLILIKYSSLEIDILRMLLCFYYEDNYFIVTELTAIILFNPERPDLIHREMVNVITMTLVVIIGLLVNSGLVVDAALVPKANVPETESWDCSDHGKCHHD
ncbi:unnamed protein product [Oppiella nova]|uniref:Uncharacterized protein n=1 Tax=Oppiella nova TaxID=334625 RepID=A0A7R9QA79_9ACAR|nr:unnamed protein product [Oppiella nova]CAG2161704.1 unnamed protein product [Oppiella nova]